MAARCPGSAPLGAAVLGGHRLVFPCRCTEWRGGVAGLAPDAKSFVEGVLWSVSDGHLAALDDYEGVDEGEYRRDRIAVAQGGGKTVEAWTYYAKAESGGPFRPTADYVATMVTGAREHGVSVPWVDMLAALAR